MTYVDYEQEGRLVTIRMNRPERRNSMSAAMMEDLAVAWDRFIADDDAWVAILTGAGNSFCSGNDLKEAQERGTFRPTYRLTYPFGGDKPTISAINGYAIGGGFVMAVSCDLRVAAEDAHLQMNEVTLGGIGGWDMGIRERLPIGVSHEISLLGGVLSGRRAYELGIVNRAVPKDRLMDTAHELAERLLGMPPQALRTMKRAMQAEAPRASGRGIEIDLNSRERLGKAADTLEAVRAFNEKRKPVFTGQ